VVHRVSERIAAVKQLLQIVVKLAKGFQSFSTSLGSLDISTRVLEIIFEILIYVLADLRP
jgi:uncharacterized protein YggT (Ycf19 family)